MEAIEKVVSALERSKDKEGYTFMEHLSEMIDRIMLSPKEYPLDKFEELSYLIKLTRLKLKQPLSDSEVKSMTRKLTDKQEWINKYLRHVFAVSKNCITDRESRRSRVSR